MQSQDVITRGSKQHIIGSLSNGQQHQATKSKARTARTNSEQRQQQQQDNKVRRICMQNMKQRTD